MYGCMNPLTAAPASSSSSTSSASTLSPSSSASSSSCPHPYFDSWLQMVTSAYSHRYQDGVRIFRRGSDCYNIPNRTSIRSMTHHSSLSTLQTTLFLPSVLTITTPGVPSEELPQAPECDYIPKHPVGPSSCPVAHASSLKGRGLSGVSMMVSARCIY